MKNKSLSSRDGGGMNFVSWLAILFITLKLCHIIDWSWWLVLLPVLIPAFLTCIYLLCLFLEKYLRKHIDNLEKDC